MKSRFLLFLLVFSFFGFAQDTLLVPIDSVEVEVPVIDSIEVSFTGNDIHNPNAIIAFYEKLYQLEQSKSGKINIVHIGDSHIQADLFTAKIRSQFQKVYGNGGFGFTFPYSVAKTNNSAPIRYTASGSFQSFRNLYADTNRPVGLSGFSMETTSKDFAIQMHVKEVPYHFTKLKVITPQNVNLFDVSISNKNSFIERKVPKKITHKVKPGEVLGGIADKYNVSLKALKKANGLKSNIIRDGKVLTIPTKGTQTKTATKIEYIPIELEPSLLSNDYVSEKPLDKIVLVPNQEIDEFALNGLVLENNASGVIYHGIGVNGAKVSDFNKFRLFNEQLPVLQPDLVIISFGTNESFDKQSGEQFFSNLDEMIQGIKHKNPDAGILVMTPPPSVLHRKYRNTFIEMYAQEIEDHAHVKNYAVWNLLEVFGGNSSINRNSAKGYMAKDKVHYSKKGYEKQGELFFESFLQSYELYKSTKL
ncbi:GDSL-type esterase/lipase family protein [Flavobacterium sp. HXWNR69]|uniref:GDSL-type esterase/lipase family protein n=1 Tax=Flavobacterium fragile TaxID=2949085 RepID=A0ABT0TFN3_9FLAO|nr:GDSL-type esterase/lipase family protein [Flavobacterium sp. HXWNR69]MCL9769795.1 GDSL-type esterase/lipase family protein [Flavobacterium sp. HXWNR69]